GFSTAPADKLYLPVDTATNAPNVASQEADPNSLLNRTRKLIAVKKSEPALANYAEFIPLYAKSNTYPFVYARANKNDVVIVVLNPSGKECTATFTVNTPFKSTKTLAGKNLKLNTNDKQVTVSIPGQSYSIIKLL
nr:alpha-amylase [Bacteroidales bacterium]